MSTSLFDDGAPRIDDGPPDANQAAAAAVSAQFRGGASDLSRLPSK